MSLEIDPAEQMVRLKVGTEWCEVRVPPAEVEVIPGVTWGSTEMHLTPAFWCAVVGLRVAKDPEFNLRCGDDVVDETVACLLGGYGIKAELAMVAFERLKVRGAISRRAGAEEIEQLLAAPFELGGRAIRYRYPRLKARYIASALEIFAAQEAPTDEMALREWLLQVPGIGLKTASWVVRNWHQSDRVAILDVHVIRAGQAMGVFRSTDRVERDYRSMEQRFLELATAMGVRASLLDMLIWDYMRRYDLWALYGPQALARIGQGA